MAIVAERRKKDTSVKTVVVWLRRAVDRKVLIDCIDHECVHVASEDLPGSEVDLVITDCLTLIARKTALWEFRQKAEPEMRAVLLVATDAELRAAHLHLGALADDVIRAPIRRVELNARIENLLRLRSLSSLQSQQKEATQAELDGTARALRAFSACNEKIIQAADERQMLANVCASLADHGGYALAWIGRAQGDGKWLEPLAKAGHAQGYLKNIAINWDDGPLAQGPVGLALRSGEMVLWSRLSRREDFSPWHEVAQAFGLESACVFPLALKAGDPETCLAIYSSDKNAFDNQELDLLQRMVDNIAHGMNAFREKERRRRSEDHAHKLAYRDSLTGLANRTATLATLDRLLRRSRPVAPALGLLYLDLDGFKLINDALGHDAGDELLAQIGGRLHTAVRDSDLIARHGGDEFTILAVPELSDGLSEPSREEMVDVMSSIAERVISLLRKPFNVRGGEYHLGVSVGISLCPHDAQEATSLLSRADSAMYQVKLRGGNSYQFFSSELSHHQQQRLALKNRLYKAVELNEFHVVFQPLVELSTGRMIGAEALLRWQLPDGEAVSPNEFIPIAEETGLISQIGDWVLKEALKALERWRQIGFSDLHVAVNFSMSQLWQSQLVPRVMAQLETLGLPPSSLSVELTESALMSDFNRMKRLVEEFNSAGISVAIDDFGTGYSSLARLKSLPVNTLKIDKSFLEGTPKDESAVQLLRTVKNMATSMGIDSLAEGIETEAQWRLLQALGCQYGQGFYFAAPMSEAALLDFLSEGKQSG